MESILQFIYFGKAMLYHVIVGEFIKVAKDLKLKDDCQADTLYDDGIDFENNYGFIRRI